MIVIERERERERENASARERERNKREQGVRGVVCIHNYTYVHLYTFGIRFDIETNESATIAVCDDCTDPF